MTKATGLEDRRAGEHRRIRELESEVKALRECYADACRLVAGMHAAAVGEVCAPARGVVQDVLDAREAARAQIEHMAELIATLSFERGKIAGELVREQTAYEQRIEELIGALRGAGVKDPAACGKPLSKLTGQEG